MTSYGESEAPLDDLFPAAELRMMCSQNAAALYRHPLPEPVLPLC